MVPPASGIISFVWPAFVERGQFQGWSVGGSGRPSHGLPLQQPAPRGAHSPTSADRGFTFNRVQTVKFGGCFPPPLTPHLEDRARGLRTIEGYISVVRFRLEGGEGNGRF